MNGTKLVSSKAAQPVSKKPKSYFLNVYMSASYNSQDNILNSEIICYNSS